MNGGNLKKNKRFILMLIAFCTYTLCYFLFLQLSSHEENHNEQLFNERVGFAKILIQADPKTIIHTNQAYQLSLDENKHIVSPIFIIQINSDEYGEKNQYYVEVPQTEIAAILKAKSLSIFDFNLKLSPPVRKIRKEVYYEINY